MKRTHLFIEIVKVKILKNEKIIKIFSILITIITIYIFKENKGSSLIFHKRYVIQYIKEFLIIYLILMMHTINIKIYTY